MPLAKGFIVINILYIFILDTWPFFGRVVFSRRGLGRPALGKEQCPRGSRRSRFRKVIFVAFTGVLGLSGTAPIDRAEESWFWKDDVDHGFLACRAYERKAGDLRSRPCAGSGDVEIHAQGGSGRRISFGCGLHRA